MWLNRVLKFTLGKGNWGEFLSLQLLFIFSALCVYYTGLKRAEQQLFILFWPYLGTKQDRDSFRRFKTLQGIIGCRSNSGETTTRKGMPFFHVSFCHISDFKLLLSWISLL